MTAFGLMHKFNSYNLWCSFQFNTISKNNSLHFRDALLLDKIGGKYGEGSDCEDIGNADEDALLEDDIDAASSKRLTFSQLDEPDSEDVLDLEAQDGDFEEDLEGDSIQEFISTSNIKSLKPLLFQIKAASINQMLLWQTQRLGN